MAIEDHISHSLAMGAALMAQPSTVLDLGAGGGVPGLVLARLAWPGAHWCLLEANARRVSFLDEAIRTLGLCGRVSAVLARAEEAARDQVLRYQFDVVVARSFGPPAVTAECAAPFLTYGGRAVISEPPDADLDRRWPQPGLAALNLVVERAQVTPIHAVTLRALDLCPDRYPRRVGIPAKRPLF